MNDLDQELKEFIIHTLNLDDITAEEIASEDPLFIDGLGLDSIDALELSVALEKKYDIKFSDEKMAKKALFSVQSLSEYIMKNKVPCLK